MKTVTKSVRIPSSRAKIFKQYLTITKPLNGLRPQEIEVVSLFLYYFIEEKENFKLIQDCWKKIFSYEIKSKVKTELNIPDYTLQNILSALRKKKVIVNNQIADYYIPKINKDTKNFQVIFDFSLDA